MTSLNRNINMFGKTIPIWFLTIAIVGAGSLAIAVGPATHMEDPPNIQEASDVKIHLQDVDGKIITNVPISASRAFSPLPVQWSAEQRNGDLVRLTQTSALFDVTSSSVGSSIATKQKLAFNFVTPTATVSNAGIRLDNLSEDR